jgi:CDP-diacylglycerol--glycerol-3-phosphate 3-phosphatidyltransferase
MMNLPNFLTVIRMGLVPVFIVFYYKGIGLGYPMEALLSSQFPAPGGVDVLGELVYAPFSLGFAIAALVVFVVAALTDAADGHIARKHGLITNFGKLMDPLADKVLTMAAFICFVDTGLIPAWPVVVIIAREFLVTGLRGVAASDGVVIAAGLSGKLKTVLQMGAIALFLLGKPLLAIAHVPTLGGVILTVATVCFWVALAVTVLSGAEYLWKCRKLLNMK